MVSFNRLKFKVSQNRQVWKLFYYLFLITIILCSWFFLDTVQALPFLLLYAFAFPFFLMPFFLSIIFVFFLAECLFDWLTTLSLSSEEFSKILQNNAHLIDKKNSFKLIGVETFLQKNKTDDLVQIRGNLYLTNKEPEIVNIKFVSTLPSSQLCLLTEKQYYSMREITFWEKMFFTWWKWLWILPGLLSIGFFILFLNSVVGQI